MAAAATPSVPKALYPRLRRWDAPLQTPDYRSSPRSSERDRRGSATCEDLRAVEREYLGKDGVVGGAARLDPRLPPEERKDVGQAANR